MRRIIMFSICIACLNTFAIYSQLVYSNFDIWCNRTPEPFIKDSVVAHVNLERHSKNILLWTKNLPGYNLEITVYDKYCIYSEIDSIVFNIYSATSKSILQSTLSECKKFIKAYNGDYAYANVSKVYMQDNLKRHRENLLVDFTLYLRTKSNEQKMITISCYELEYKKFNGIYLWPF